MRKENLKKITCAIIIVFIFLILTKLTIKNPADNDSCLLYYSYDNIIVRIENEIKPQVFTTTEEESNSEWLNRITSVAEDKNTKDIYFIVDTQNYNGRKSFQTIYHIGKDGKQETVDVLDNVHLITIDVCNGRLYTLTRIYDIHDNETNIIYEETVYELTKGGTYSKKTKNQQLYNRLCNDGGYEPISAIRNDGRTGLYTIPYCIQNFGKIMMSCKEENSIVLFDKDGEEKSKIELKYKLLDLYVYNNDCIIYSSEKENNWKLIYYDLITNEEKILTENKYAYSWKILGYEDGKLYYAVTEQWDSESDTENLGSASGRNKIYEYCVNSDEEQLIYKGDKLPGMDKYYEPGISGFKINSGKCYFLGTDGKDMAWYMINLNNNSKEVIPLDVVTKHYEFTDYGTISYKSNNKCCSECGLELFSRYVEVFALDERYEGAQIINQELMAEMKEELKREPAIIEHEYHKKFKHFSSSKYVKRIENVQSIGKHYLEINYSGYFYETGMGHGEPFREHEMFNIETGKKVGFSDFYTGSLDEFKSKVAEYTIKDWKENPQKYFSQIEEEFYESVYNYASYDMPMQFTNEGIIVEYGPYHYGPFSSGIISIKIPYEEFDVVQRINT
ncbi:MAG: RsiV family protein [Lachnospiraceae bacterium]|nr:RsiV family protein [Lachnospiraceae bacterium]